MLLQNVNNELIVYTSELQWYCHVNTDSNVILMLTIFWL